MISTAMLPILIFAAAARLLRQFPCRVFHSGRYAMDLGMYVQSARRIHGKATTKGSSHDARPATHDAGIGIGKGPAPEPIKVPATSQEEPSPELSPQKANDDHLRDSPPEQPAAGIGANAVSESKAAHQAEAVSIADNQSLTPPADGEQAIRSMHNRIFLETLVEIQRQVNEARESMDDISILLGELLGHHWQRQSIPYIESFEAQIRRIEAMDAGFHESVTVFLSTLRDYTQMIGLEPIQPEPGAPLNLTEHRVFLQPSRPIPPSQAFVQEVVRKGWRSRTDKAVLRPAEISITSLPIADLQRGAETHERPLTEQTSTGIDFGNVPAEPAGSEPEVRI